MATSPDTGQQAATIRTLTRGDARGAGRALAASHQDDPMMVHLFRDAARPGALRALFTASARDAAPLRASQLAEVNGRPPDPPRHRTIRGMSTRGYARAWFAAAAAVAAAALLVQLVLVLLGDDGGPVARVVRFLSYFTVESNILVAVVCALLARDASRDSARSRVAHLDSVLCITVTGLVYVSVLRGRSSWRASPWSPTCRSWRWSAGCCSGRTGAGRCPSFGPR